MTPAPEGFEAFEAYVSLSEELIHFTEGSIAIDAWRLPSNLVVRQIHEFFYASLFAKGRMIALSSCSSD
ncbi:hypothetical protein PGTUg99_037724 [Puccinia graminis f. sp. tritici]|uniref:Uncharacterized protein n=1 Tax=Puccinia graminis f. sp. tritici TaxID=56615 RepID=A0A5B0RAY4_PUCGR|nr:hypothetical protein PGTUg99_037724 [Puccinia graminis f. sp. tritici]